MLPSLVQQEKEASQWKNMLFDESAIISASRT